MKLSKNTITELVKIVVTAAISVLSTLGILSCTVNTGNHDVPYGNHANNDSSNY